MTKELQDLVWSVLPTEFKEEVKYEYSRVATKAIKSSYDLGFMNAHEGMYGIHNLTSDAEGEEMLTVKASTVKDIYNSMNKAHPKENAWVVKQTLEALFGSKCLPDEEPKPAEPKFKVGDKVRIVSLHGRPTPHKGDIDMVAHINNGNEEQMYYLENHFYCAYGFSESDLEPYTESKDEESATLHAESVKESRIASEESHLRNFSQETANCDKRLDDILTDSFRNHNRLHIAAMAMQAILGNPDEVYRAETCGKAKQTPQNIAEYALACADALIAECGKGSQA